MLHKTRSTQTALMKYGLIAPLFMLMIVVSSATLATKPIEQMEEFVQEVSDKNNSLIDSEKVTLISDNTEIKNREKGNPKDPNLDLSKAVIISPALVDEVKNYTKRDSTEVFNAVEQQAEYPGGLKAFGEYLATNLKYPAEAQKANKSGKVYVQFIVNTDGSTSNFEVLKSAGFGFDEEALRVISSVPKWIAGKQSGRVVRSRFTVPINFLLTDDTKNSRSIFERKDEPKNILNKPELNSIVLYIVDGMEMDVKGINLIDPKSIESMEVLKGEKATLFYGEKGKNGVVIIKMKKK